jgi:hypothetical protein
MDTSPATLDFQREYDAWQQASPVQLIRLLKLLGVEQRRLAAFLDDITVSCVSMWATGTRKVPRKYHARILVYAHTQWKKAIARMEKEVAALPTDELKRATIMEWRGRFARWSLEVLHERGVLVRDLREESQRLGALVAKDTLTENDLDWIISLAQTITSQAETLKAIKNTQEPVPEESHV